MTGNSDASKEPSDDIIRPLLPTSPIPKQPINYSSTRRIFSKDVIGDLPLQHVSSNRRIEDLDDDEYGYSTFGEVRCKPKMKDNRLEDTFIDAIKFDLYKENGHNPVISTFSMSPKGTFDSMALYTGR